MDQFRVKMDHFNSQSEWWNPNDPLNWIKFFNHLVVVESNKPFSKIENIAGEWLVSSWGYRCDGIGSKFRPITDDVIHHLSNHLLIHLWKIRSEKGQIRGSEVRLGSKMVINWIKMLKLRWNTVKVCGQLRSKCDESGSDEVRWGQIKGSGVILRSNMIQIGTNWIKMQKMGQTTVKVR